MYKVLLGAFVLLFTFASCNGQNESEHETEVVFETNLGDIRIKLFNDTPLHRDNFIKNVKEGCYDDKMWHRIIRNFMIQTGEQPVGLTEEGDTIPADTSKWIPSEIVYPKYYHKRGMVGAAREGDADNPNWKSDPHQFYIVTGRTYLDDGIRELQAARQQIAVQRLYDKKVKANAERIEGLRKARDTRGLSNALEKLLDEAKFEISKNPPQEYTEEQKRYYRTAGGAPWLDGEYTVFGEVVEGMKTVKAIEKVKTGANDRPVADVKVIRAYVVE